MIDNEQLVYDEVAKAVREKFDGIFIIGTEITDVPPRFPALYIIKKNSSVNERGSTFDYVENVATEEYEFGAYSNLESQKDAKTQCKEIIAVIDGVMCDLTYIRSFCQPIPCADTKYSRHVARYRNNNIT